MPLTREVKYPAWDDVVGSPSVGRPAMQSAYRFYCSTGEDALRLHLLASEGERLEDDLEEARRVWARTVEKFDRILTELAD